MVQTASKKQAFAESFIKVAKKLKKRQPNIPIGLFVSCPFKEYFSHLQSAEFEILQKMAFAVIIFSEGFGAVLKI